MSKFIISKGMSNEFIFTIKQNGSTLGMKISDSGAVVDSTTATMSSFYTVIPEVEAVEAQAAVTAVSASAGQPYIAAIAGVKERYKITMGANTAGVVYKITVNPSSINTNTYTYSITGNLTTYPSKADVLTALATAINNATANQLSAWVDYNTLFIEADTAGTTLNINTNDSLYINEIRTAVTPVAGQAYIAPTEAVAAKAAVTAVAYSPEKYTVTSTAYSVSTTSLTKPAAYTQYVTINSGSVSAVKVGTTTISKVDGKYDIGTATAFTITPTAVTNSTTKPEDITYTVEVVSTQTQDEFVFFLYDKKTDALVGTVDMTNGTNGQITVHDAYNGKIKLTLKAAFVNSLEKTTGEFVDGKYLVAGYRGAIDCNTLNNGTFVAKLPSIYVE